MTDPSPAYLITGGTSGLGRAAAKRLSDDGARVWIAGTRQASVDETCTELGLTGGTECDVSDPAQVQALLSAATQDLGQLDGVFINAGIDGQGVPAAELEVDFFRRVLEVNVLGSFLIAKAVLPHLARGGAILFNASVNALRPELNYLDYNASKAAVASMTQSLAMELAPDGIRVNCVAPGYFPTRMTESFLSDPVSVAQALMLIPAGRVGDPAELADLVAYLLGPAPAFLTGTVIPIDGGRSIL
jgi:NAD(P)-dependent dehydrogenase (short-subunit alcohol dehydrogenase family)